MMNFQWKMKALCTFFDGIHIPGTMKIAILHVKKHWFWCSKWTNFCYFFSSVCIPRKLKSTDFSRRTWWWFCMKNEPFFSDFDAHPYTGNVFFARFFSFFFDLKNRSWRFWFRVYEWRFCPKFFLLKHWVFFCSWKKLVTQRYRRSRAFFVIFCVFVSQK